MDDLVKWVTFVGAVVAALTGLQSFFWQALDRRDRVLVKLGCLEPPISPGDGMYVVNTSKHPIELHDYGFVLNSGELFSLPSYFVNDGLSDQANVTFSGKTKLEPKASFEVYVDFTNIEVVGAYARTTTQNSPTIQIGYHSNLFRKWWYLFRVWWFHLFRY